MCVNSCVADSVSRSDLKILPSSRMDIKISVEDECLEGSLTSYCKDVEMVKLFVGQVPRCWEDGELRDVMEAYGPIQELTILKDRTDGTSKGVIIMHHASSIFIASS